MGLGAVGVVLILVALSTPVCAGNSYLLSGCGSYGTIYAAAYFGIALLIIGVILCLISMRRKSVPSTESEQRRKQNENRTVKS